MTVPIQHSLSGSSGKLVFWEWPNADATFVALIAHGYAEHARRYDHVAERLVVGGRGRLRARPHGPRTLGG